MDAAIQTIGIVAAVFAVLLFWPLILAFAGVMLLYVVVMG